MSFDLFVYMLAIPKDLGRRVEETLARHNIAAHCRYYDESAESGGTLGVAYDAGGEFENEDDATFVDFRPVESLELEEWEDGTAEERAIVRACRWEAGISTPAGRDDVALAKQVRAAVAVMEACGGVLHDPQAEEKPYFFDVARAWRWADAVIDESASG
jgi:hypothetical protein